MTTVTFDAKLFFQGNSLVVAIPKPLLKSTGMRKGSKVKLSLFAGDKILISK